MNKTEMVLPKMMELKSDFRFVVVAGNFRADFANK